jgi:carotenoid cleavage dioxygenase-like enzyme
MTVPPRWSRRDALKLGGLGAAALAHPPFWTGCGSSPSEGDPSGSAGAPGADAGAFVPPTFDPERSWWTQYNYASVAERDAVDLVVEGALPPELDGLYVRNGSNPASGDPGHWFLGDGMLHGVRIQGGRALWYKNRYVQTDLYRGGEGYGGGGPPSGGNNTSNVSVVHHAGKLLTSGEVGFPYRIDPADLSTLGVYDFGGALTGFFTAHPKIDAVTGEMLMFGYNFGPPYVTYHRVDAEGTIVQTEGIELPASVMMHDFAITATRVVFMDLPIVLDLQMVVDQESAFPFRWEGSHVARLGVMPRTGTNADVRWFEIDSCFIFHVLNAYDHPSRPDVVVLTAARHPKLWETGPNDFDSRPQLYRYEFDLGAGTVSAEPLDDRMTEFVQLDRRLVGRPNRYGYGVWLDEPVGAHPGRFQGLLKWDLERGAAVTAHELAPHLETGEPYFVPAAGDASEDDGYLMTFVYDWADDTSALWLLDASRLEAPPIAKVKLPFRVPFGFHGMWVPA